MNQTYTILLAISAINLAICQYAADTDINIKLRAITFLNHDAQYTVEVSWLRDIVRFSVLAAAAV